MSVSSLGMGDTDRISLMDEESYLEAEVLGPSSPQRNGVSGPKRSPHRTRADSPAPQLSSGTKPLHTGDVTDMQMFLIPLTWRSADPDKSYMTANVSVG